MKTIYTIGHSTHTLKEFLKILTEFGIETLVDVRRYPGSRKFPHFNKEALEKSMPENGIEYIHLVDLGGRRKPREDSKNTVWQHPSFRGYADYMETDDFKNAIKKLSSIARDKPTAYMCSEVLWWRCHRALISDLLKSNGWEVWHIMGIDKKQEHPYTKPAKIVDGKLEYPNS